MISKGIWALTNASALKNTINWYGVSKGLAAHVIKGMNNSDRQQIDPRRMLDGQCGLRDGKEFFEFNDASWWNLVAMRSWKTKVDEYIQ
jgi:hypothetical protein